MADKAQTEKVRLTAEQWKENAARFTSKKRLKRVTPVAQKGSSNGLQSFSRAFFSMLIILLLSVASTPLFTLWDIGRIPDDVWDTTDVALWFTSSMMLPHLLLFISVSFLTIWILSLQNMKYCLWIVRQAVGGMIMSYLIIETISMTLLGLTFYTKPINFFATNSNTGTSQVQETMWMLSLSFVVIVAWFGYKTGWKSYRILGAQTMQQRYEEDMRIMEIKTSGRLWDRVTKFWLKKLLGFDGNKPRGFAINIFFGLFIVFAFYAIYQSFDLEFSVPVALWFAPSVPVFFSAAVAKYRDGKYNLKRPSYLNKARDKDTVDEYDPSSKGIREFVQ